MPKINLKLRDVGCRKPGCKHKLERTSRHHRGCETMFIRAFRQKRGKQWKALVARYDSFEEKDIVRLCQWHHCEIHLIYDKIVLDDKAERGKHTLVDYTWDEAKSLMSRLRKMCKRWEKKKTPGIDPDECAPARRFPKYRGPNRRTRRKKGRRK